MMQTKRMCAEVFWIPGINRLESYGCWAFLELKEVYKMESEFEAKVKVEFDKMMREAVGK